MTVTLESPPAHGATLTNEVPASLSCTATIGPDENLTRLSLYYENNESTVWAEQKFDTDMQSGGTKVFSVSGLINATYTWNCLALSNDSIETWAGSNNTFSITFTTAATPSNNPPTWQQSNNKSTTEDSGTTLIVNLDYDSSDTENDAALTNLTYSVQSESGSSIIDCSISGAEMSCGPPAANQSGDNIVAVRATDSGSLTADVVYNISVTPVNDEPYLKTIIPDQNWSKDATKKIDLDDYFSDPDGDTLTYNYTFISSGTNMNVTIASDGETTFTPASGWTGTETLNFTAYDAVNLSVVSNEVTLTVYVSSTANQPPSIDSYDPKTNPIISVGVPQTFKINKSDPNSGDTLSVIWYVDGIVKEGETGNSFMYTASTVGEFIILVNVSDGQASTTKTWALTVKTSAGTNQTAPPAEKTGENVTACGDNKCSEDEEQLSCCKDCGCPEGYTCKADTGKCTKEKKAGNIILLAVVLGLFVGGAGVGLYLYKKKQEQEIFGGLANAPISLPPKGEVKKEELIVKKPQEPVKKAEKAQEKPFKETKTTSQVLLKNFIITNLKKGKSLDQIKEELHKVGWTEEQINDAYTAAQLDEVFS